MLARLALAAVLLAASVHRAILADPAHGVLDETDIRIASVVRRKFVCS
jgi:hypothetical protein